MGTYSSVISNASEEVGTGVLLPSKQMIEPSGAPLQRTLDTKNARLGADQGYSGAA